MSLLEWNSIYETGIIEVDSEHKILVSIIQRLESAIARNDKDNTLKIIMELLKYANSHFYNEENIMIREEYPDYYWHKKIHERLLIELQDKITVLQYEYIDFTILLHYLISWFKEHTIHEDKKIAEYIASRK